MPPRSCDVPEGCGAADKGGCPGPGEAPGGDAGEAGGRPARTDAKRPGDHHADGVIEGRLGRRAGRHAVAARPAGAVDRPGPAGHAGRHDAGGIL